MSNPHLTANEQPGTQMPVVAYDQMFPFLFTEIDQHKAEEIRDLFDKYKRNEIPRNTFYSFMKDIVGEEKLLAASKKLQQVNEQSRTQISFRLPVVPYNQIFPFLFREIDQDKADQLQLLFDNYKRGEISRYGFVSLIKGIAGEEKVKSAEAKLKQQKKNLLPMDQLFHYLISHVDPDKAIELQALFDKYKRGAIAKYTFVPFMKVILGDQMLRTVTAKVKQQKRNLPIPVNEQPRTQMNSSELVLPFDKLLPFLISHIDPDQVIDLEGFFDKYKRGEIANRSFVSFMKLILGEQMVRLATSKLIRQKKNLLVPVNEQPRTLINSSEGVVPFDQLFRFLISQVDPDKAIELQTLFDKFKRGEIAKHTFVPFMKDILGDQMLRTATEKWKQQKTNMPVPVNEQPGTQINSSELVVPFYHLLPFLISDIDPDKLIELEAFFGNYERGIMANRAFVSTMKRILGEQILRLNSRNETTDVLRAHLSRRHLSRRYISRILNAATYLTFLDLVKVFLRGEISKYVFVSLIKRIAGEEKIRSAEAKLKQQRGAIAKHTFVPFMKGILGDQMLRTETAKVKQQKRYLPVPVNEQPQTQINSSELVVPFDQLLPFLISHIDPDKGIDLEAIFDKYKRGEMTDHTFVSIMQVILGEQMLRLATAKLIRQKITNGGSSGTAL